MTDLQIERLGIRVKAVPGRDGKATVTVHDASGAMLRIDTISILRAAARKRFVVALPEEVQGEAAKALEDLAERCLSENGKSAGEAQGSAVTFEDVELWPEPVDGADLLDEIEAAIQRHVILSGHAARAVSLWCLSTWSSEAFDVAAILCVSSVAKRCGKTTLQRIIRNLVKRPLAAGNISASAMFRVIERDGPTLLIDEGDSFLKEKEELRGILNAGISRGDAFVIRTVGDDHEPRQFGVFGPKSIALIGKLPDTLEDRSIPVRMERKTRGETVERFREREAAETFRALRRRMARWAKDSVEALTAARVSPPESLNDRASDLWEPLLTIAEIAGEGWGEKARAAAVALAGDGTVPDESPKMILLSDLRAVLTNPEIAPKGRIASKALVEALAAMEERPWARWDHGKPITPNGVAWLLRGFDGVSSKTLRIDDERSKGYDLESCADAFERYLGPEKRDTVISRASIDESGHPEVVTGGDASRIENQGFRAPVGHCHGVTAERGGAGAYLFGEGGNVAAEEVDRGD